jgi:hypothetical protein
MLKIEKYELRPYIKIPKDAKVLRMATEGNRIFLWALIDLADKKQLRSIRLYEAGDIVADTDVYLGSAVSPNGTVWLVFEHPLSVACQLDIEQELLNAKQKQET